LPARVLKEELFSGTRQRKLCLRTYEAALQEISLKVSPVSRRVLSQGMATFGLGTGLIIQGEAIGAV